MTICIPAVFGRTYPSSCAYCGALQGRILALVCAELSALCAKCPEKTHRSLTTLFAELDTSRFALSTLARPQYLLSQQSVLTDNNGSFKLKRCLVLLNNTICATNSNQSASREIFGIGAEAV